MLKLYTGFGGLTAAIECHRQGHEVEIYESFPGKKTIHRIQAQSNVLRANLELKVLGDIISFGPNAGRIYKRWDNGKIAEKMRELSINLTEYGFRIHKYDTGEIVTTQRGPPPDPDAPVFNGHRGELHSIVFNHAKNDLGIPIHLGHRVTQYWEDEEQAGIVLDDGTKVGQPKQSLAQGNG